ncbi:MAG: LPS assembly lipoprotein LptE [Verrucomicrobiales bacterium]
MTTHLWARAWTVVFLVLWAVGSAGCVGYQLGHKGTSLKGSDSIQIKPIQNSTQEPGLGEALSFALRQQIQRDGAFALETQNRGDILLEATVTSVRRNKLTLDPQDVLTIRDFEILVTAQFKATRQPGGEVLMQKEITGKTNSRAASDLTEAERRVLPLVMQDMAQQAIDQLSTPDW